MTKGSIAKIHIFAMLPLFVYDALSYFSRYLYMTCYLISFPATVGKAAGFASRMGRGSGKEQ